MKILRLLLIVICLSFVNLTFSNSGSIEINSDTIVDNNVGRMVFLKDKLENQEKGLDYMKKIDAFILKINNNKIILTKVKRKVLLIQDKANTYDFKKGQNISLKKSVFEIKLVLEYFLIKIKKWFENIEKLKQLKIKERKKISKNIKSVYYTTYSAVSTKKIDSLINLVKNTEINSVTIDIKNVNWYVAFDMSDYKFDRIKSISNGIIKNPKKLIEKLHNNGIYVIARIVVFKDNLLTSTRPDLSIKWSTDKKAVWYDYKWKKYLDPSSKEVWDYNLNIANAAYQIWFDEINFDYIRFPTDWKISKTYYPFSSTILYHNPKLWKIVAIDRFSNYITTKLRELHPNIILSADVFWLVTRWDMLQIWQNLESFLIYFDFVWPMVYPSHYWANFLGFKQPDNHPYEVLQNAISSSNKKINKLNKEIKLARIEKRKIKINDNLTTDISFEKIEKIDKSKLRLWIQWFSCTRCKGATLYNRKKFRKQIKAIEESWLNSWWVWSSGSNYYYNRYNK